jgi:hypothetical protein
VDTSYGYVGHCADLSKWGTESCRWDIQWVYFQDLQEQDRELVKMLVLTDIAQVDVLNDYGLLIVLSGRLHLSLSPTNV